MRTLLGIALSALMLVGCAIVSNDDPSSVSPSQRILFEVEYVNYAWGFVWQGFYIDNQGAVYTYQLDTMDQRPGDKETLTEQDLLTKYSHQQTVITQIDTAQLFDMVTRIPSALEGILTEPESRCADAGVVAFRTFRYEEATARYTPVVLKQEGDWRRENTSSSARALVVWLRTLDEQFSNPLCG